MSKHFENKEYEQSSLADLIKRMDQLFKKNEILVYDPCYMNGNLEEFYGEDIIISDGFGIKQLQGAQDLQKQKSHDISRFLMTKIFKIP